MPRGGGVLRPVGGLGACRRAACPEPAPPLLPPRRTLARDPAVALKWAHASTRRPDSRAPTKPGHTRLLRGPARRAPARGRRWNEPAGFGSRVFTLEHW